MKYDMSKIVQAERKAKTRFQALLRRSRCSRRASKTTCQTRVDLFDDAKVRQSLETAA